MFFASPARSGMTFAVTAARRRIHAHHAIGAQSLFISDRTAMRKVQEALPRIQIERAFTKEQIFTLYGNQIYLGSGNYGFEPPRNIFFEARQGSDAHRSALLAGCPRGQLRFRRCSILTVPCAAATLCSARWSRMAQSPHAGCSGAQHTARPEQARPWACAPWFEDAVREELDKRFARKKCMRTVCASTPRSIWTCKTGQSRRR